jgi:hypothetical protein
MSFCHRPGTKWPIRYGRPREPPPPLLELDELELLELEPPPQLLPPPDEWEDPDELDPEECDPDEYDPPE